jgi:hypothetical protein
MTLMCVRGIAPVQGYPVRANVILSDAKDLGRANVILSEAKDLGRANVIPS